MTMKINYFKSQYNICVNAYNHVQYVLKRHPDMDVGSKLFWNQRAKIWVDRANEIIDANPELNLERINHQ